MVVSCSAMAVLSNGMAVPWHLVAWQMLNPRFPFRLSWSFFPVSSSCSASVIIKGIFKAPMALSRCQQPQQENVRSQGVLSKLAKCTSSALRACVSHYDGIHARIAWLAVTSARFMTTVKSSCCQCKRLPRSYQYGAVLGATAIGKSDKEEP